MNGHHLTGYIKYITDNEFKQIINFFEELQSPPMKMLCLTMAYSGVRSSDAAELNLKNFDVSFSKLTIEMHKTKKVLEIMLPSFFSERLKAYYSEYSHRMTDDYLFFASWRNQSQNKHIGKKSLAGVFNRLRKELNLNSVFYKTKGGIELHRVSPHVLRHYVAYKINSVSNITTAQRWLGHSSINMTAKYIDAINAANNMQEIAEKAFA